ncbi:unnamed protein product, partial [Symbiodinium natans]
VGSSITLETYGCLRQHRSSFYDSKYGSPKSQAKCSLSWPIGAYACVVRLSWQETTHMQAPVRFDHDKHLRKMKSFLKDFMGACPNRDVEAAPFNFQDRVESVVPSSHRCWSPSML